MSLEIMLGEKNLRALCRFLIHIYPRICGYIWQVCKVLGKQHSRGAIVRNIWDVSEKMMQPKLISDHF